MLELYYLNRDGKAIKSNYVIGSIEAGNFTDITVEKTFPLENI